MRFPIPEAADMGVNRYLVFLRWPEKCFRANAADLACLRRLVPAGSVVEEAKNERDFLRRLPQATHAIVWQFRPEWFALAPHLKALATPAAGRELVPVEGPKGVRIHFGGFHGATMAESVAAFMLAWSRGFLLHQPAPWPRTWTSDKCRNVAGTRAIVLGYGKVGRAIGAKLEALGVEVQGFSRHCPLTAAELRRLAPDWLILALPSDTGTDDLVDAKFLARLPRQCVLVNVGRGNVVDEVALAAALRSRRLAGAYLDVLKYEPTFAHPRRAAADARTSRAFALGKVPNCVVMPHAAAFTMQYMRLCFDELARDGWLA